MRPENLIASCLLATITMTCHAGLFSRDDTQTRIEALFKETRPICFGRFLIDVPKDAYVVANASKYRWEKINLSKGISLNNFQQMLIAKENQLKDIKHKTDPSILRYIKKNNDGLSNIFIFWETPTSRGLLKTESFKWLKGNQFLIKGNVAPEKIAIAVDLANRSLNELQYRSDNDIPMTPGFCVDGGFFVGSPLLPHHEQAYLQIRFKKNPDVSVVVSTDMNGEQIEEGLIARVNNHKTPIDYIDLLKQVKTLRKGKHAVAGIKGEEVLETIPASETYSFHLFNWESSGKPKDIYAPNISVNLETGETLDSKKMRPTLSDKEVIELFDSIVNSIRIRPITDGAVDDQPTPEKPTPPRPQSKVPLGTQIASANRCPQSGTWTCDQAEALGGNRRFFHEGETLPSVLLPISRNLWQSLRGDAANQPQATTWTLVALPEDME